MTLVNITACPGVDAPREPDDHMAKGDARGPGAMWEEGAAPRAAYPCWTVQPDSLALVPSLSPHHPLLTQPRGMVGLLCFLLSALDCPHVEILPESAGLTLPACAELRSCINPVMQITDGCTQACRSRCALGTCPRAVLGPGGQLRWGRG